MDLLDLTDYGPKNGERYRFEIIVTEKLGNFGWIVPLYIKLLEQ